MITTTQDLGLKITTLQVAGYGGAPCSQQLALQMKETLNVNRLVVSTRQIAIKSKTFLLFVLFNQDSDIGLLIL